MINNEAKNIDNEKYISIKKNNIKKEINKILNEEKYNNQKIIVDNGSSLLEKFENQLFNIFCDKNEKIQIVDIYKLKKLSTALLIKYKNIKPPLELSKIFFEKNMNINDIDEDTRIKIIMKKSNVYNEINDAQLREINKNDKDNFMKELREKYGILDEDICDKELKYEIEYRNYNENEIIKLVLEKLGYI